MKKMMLALIATMLISGSAQAQDESKKEGQRPDPKEMIQKRTDAVVEKYGLNEEQAAKLLELNTAFAEKMPQGGRGGRPGGRGQGDPQGGPGQGGPQGPQGERPDSVGQPPMPQPEGGDSIVRQAPPQDMKGGPQGGPQGGEDFKAIMEEYDKSLQEILTAEQYEAYKKDRAERQHRQPRGGRPESAPQQ